MKRGLLLFLAVASLTAQAKLQKPAGMPDLPPDASSEQLWSEFGDQFGAFGTQAVASGPIQDAIDLGIRNLNWLRYINDRRADDNKVSLTSKATTGGIPIEKPSEYSPAIVQTKLDKLKTDLPQEIKEILFDNNKAFTPDVPIAQDKFIEWGRKVDGLYQTALRWQGMQRWLPYLEMARSEDIHGIYFFNKMDPAAVQAKLRDPSLWTTQEKTDLSDWLVSMCLNNNIDLAICRQQVTAAAAGPNSVYPLYQGWRVAAQRTWDGFFTIQGARSDIHITDPNRLDMPFRDPADPTVLAFLRDNIEDEWHFGTWFLKMAFNGTASAHVIFKSGVTPHVNGLGGDEITMNSDQPLTEYDAQWTIRHEFGHVLGLPDCYVEYYDSEKGSIVNYQLDIDNLMCSRHGHIQQKHVDELLRAYRTSGPVLN